MKRSNTKKHFILFLKIAPLFFSFFINLCKIVCVFVLCLKRISSEFMIHLNFSSEVGQLHASRFDSSSYGRNVVGKKNNSLDRSRFFYTPRSWTEALRLRNLCLCRPRTHQHNQPVFSLSVFLKVIIWGLMFFICSIKRHVNSWQLKVHNVFR